MASVSKKRKRFQSSNTLTTSATTQPAAVEKRYQGRRQITENEKSNTKSATTKRGLPRPKTNLLFSPPNRDKGSILSVPPSRSGSQSPALLDGAKSSIKRLRDILHITNLIIRRNKNQHRAQPFWKYLSLLYRSLQKLLSLHEQILSTSLSHLSSQGVRPSAEDVRKQFEIESRLRSEKEILEEHIRENLVPECYIRFSSVVGDTQFANLGLVLTGILADVAGVVGLMKHRHNASEQKPTSTTKVHMSNYTKRRDDSPMSIVGTSIRVTGEDQGEVVERMYGTSGNDGAENHGNDMGTVVARHGKVSEQRGPALEMPTKTEIFSSRSSPPQQLTTANRVDDTLKSRHKSSTPRPQAERAAIDSAEVPTAGELQAKNVPLPSETRSKGSSKTKGKMKQGSKKKGGAFDDLFKGLI